MKKLLLAAALALACSACTVPAVSIPTSPAVVADQTPKDEQAALSVELAYKAVRMASELAVDAGALKGSAAATAARLDARAYAAVLATRAAYQAGNADDYLVAARAARAAVAEFLAAIGD